MTCSVCGGEEFYTRTQGNGGYTGFVPVTYDACRKCGAEYNHRVETPKRCERCGSERLDYRSFVYTAATHESRKILGRDYEQCLDCGKVQDEPPR